MRLCFTLQCTLHALLWHCALAVRPAGREAELLEHQVERVTGSSQVKRASKCEEDAQAPADPTEACPSECPFAAELSDPTKYCHFKCVKAEECGTKGTISNQTIPEKNKVKENKYCRYCEVEACADCTAGRPGEESEAVETCKKCMPGYTLKNEGKECVSHGDWVFLALAAVAGVGALVGLAWFATLQLKPTVNPEGLQYGMYSQLRMMVTQDHHGDEGQPYPFNTNLLSVHVAGPGGTALFRFQAAAILWGLLVTAPAADGLPPAWWPAAEREAASAWLLKSGQLLPGDAMKDFFAEVRRPLFKAKMSPVQISKPIMSVESAEVEAAQDTLVASLGADEMRAMHLTDVCPVNHPAMRDSERCFGLSACAASAAVAALHVQDEFWQGAVLTNQLSCVKRNQQGELAVVFLTCADADLAQHLADVALA